MRLPDGYRSIRQITSADGCRTLCIFRRSDGLFGYVGEKFTVEDGDSFWEPAEHSGIFETAELAEQAALAEVNWLWDRSS